MNCHEAIVHGEEILSLAGVTDPKWNAERLLILALKTDRVQLYSDFQRELSEAEATEYESLLQKRSEHYPLAYLEGTQEFFGHSFHVDPSVLIPRPETEEIVHAALDLPLPAAPVIIDLGAGSGCLAITLAREIQDCTVIALEYSFDALRMLRENSGQAVEIVRGNLYTTPFVPESFDLIVSNPPYVEQGAELPPETKWEPSLALMAESLEQIYDTLLLQALRILKPGGYVVFEIGFGQQERIKEVVNHHPELRLLQIRNDYRNLPRTFVLKKK
jgi:release factor glutamine methyltransferase